MRSGTVAIVWDEYAGSETTASAVKGALTLLVADASDFVNGSGLIDVGRMGQPFAYDSCDLNDDGTTGTIHVSAGIPAAVASGVRVDVWAADRPVVEFFAGVMFPGAEGPETVGLPPELAPLFPLGSRDEGEQEAVDVAQDEDGVWWVLRPRQQAPKVDLGYSDPDRAMPAGPVTNGMHDNLEDWRAGIRPESVGSGEIAGDISLRGQFASGDYGGLGKTVHNDQGDFTWQPDGTPKTQFPNDPLLRDHLRGNADLDRAVVSDGITLYGDSQGASSGTFRLRSNINPPGQPTVTQYWGTVQYAGTQKPGNKAGLALGSGTNAYTLIRRSGSPTVTAQFNWSTGAYVGTFQFSGAPGSSPTFVASIGYSSVVSKIVTLVNIAGAWWVRYWSLPSGGTVAYSSQWQWTDGDPYDGTNWPAITCINVGGVEHLTIAQSQSDGKVKLRRYDTHVLAATVTTAAVLNAGNLAGIANLTGPERYVVAAQVQLLDANGLPCMAVVDVAGTPGADLGTLPVGNANAVCAGISTPATGGTVTYYLSAADQAVISHQDPAQSGEYQVEAAYINGSSSIQTLPGPAAQFTKIAGTSVVFALGSIPAGADGIAWYAGQGSGTLPNSSFYQQLGSGGTTLSLRVNAVVLAGSNPLTSATLTTGVAFKFVAEDGTTLMDATGFVAGGGGGSGGWNFLNGGNAHETGWGSVSGGTASSTGSGNVWGGNAA